MRLPSRAWFVVGRLLLSVFGGACAGKRSMTAKEEPMANSSHCALAGRGGVLSALKVGGAALGAAAAGAGIVLGGCRAVYEWGSKAHATRRSRR